MKSAMTFFSHLLYGFSYAWDIQRDPAALVGALQCT